MQKVVNQPLDNVANRIFKIEQQIVYIVSQGQYSFNNIVTFQMEVAAIKL
jgi:hypothetical protein